MIRNAVRRAAVLTFSVVVFTGAAVGSLAGTAFADANHSGSASLFVSSHSHASNAGTSCSTAKFSTIQAAVDAAAPHRTVVVCSGTYHEDVVISKALSLRGADNPLIEAAPTSTRMCQFLVMGPPLVTAPCLAAVTITASSVQVSGFTVTGSQGEGILATGSLRAGSISDVSIVGNVVTDNDLGGTTSAYPQCQGPEPDCGEGVHLMGVRHSVVSHNRIIGNSGGVLLTDEFGPTDDNIVASNIVADNTRDCGITLPGHNPFAYNSTTKKLQPDRAGVFDNTVRDNVIVGNGTKGFGAGALIAVPIPGSASYDNLVTGNFIAGNGLAGVTLHDHLPGGAYMNQNKIIGNVIGKNNLLTDMFDTNPPAPLKVPTGITVYSGADPVSITIADNLVFDNTFGLWRTTNVIVHGFPSNRFQNVTTAQFSTSPK